MKPPLRKPQGDMTDRQIKALGRLGRTKAGRQIIAECREGILRCLVEGLGKP